MKENECKPEAEKVGWVLNNTKYLYESHWYKLRQDELTLPNSKKATYTYLEHPGSVFIVPITPEKKIVIIRSYRYTIDKWCWEVPAGSLGDIPHLKPKEVAVRELREELGMKTEELEFLGQFYLSNGVANFLGHFYIARNVVFEQPQTLEDTEIIDQIKMNSSNEVLNMIKRGEFEDGDSAFAILLALKSL